jgi:hypothetical protein
LLIGRENFVRSDKIGNGENGVEIIDCADFFLINHINRGAENFAENDKIGSDENDVGIADCEEFFFNYTDRCAVSLHFANLVIVIAAVKTASIYRF